MRFKNRGRKIYKTKEKNYYGKSPLGKFFSGALTILLIGGIGFLGYSVAEPLINYSKKRGDEETVSSTEATEEASEMNDSTYASEPATMPTAAAGKFLCHSVSEDDLVSSDQLKFAMQRISSDSSVEYISVPLKVEGGEIYYASKVLGASESGAVKSAITLNEIVSEIKNAGYKPAAEISILRDNIFPLTYKDSGYTLKDSGSAWLDDSAENGGKPWLSPFSETAQSYIRGIASEASEAGFEKIICSDMVFPPFRESDLALIGNPVSGSDRYTGLTMLANMLYNDIFSSGSSMMLEVSAVDILQENNEVIQPMLLDVSTIVLDIDFDEIGDEVIAPGTVYEFSGTAAERASKAMELVMDSLDGYNVVVKFSGSEIRHSGFADAAELLAGYGLSSYII